MLHSALAKIRCCLCPKWVWCDSGKWHWTLDEAAITHALNEVVHRMALPGPRRRAHVAVDATGLAQGAVSTLFVRRIYHHTQQPLPWRHWLKWLAVVDLKRQLILAQSARQAPWNDCANLPGLVAQAQAHTPIGCVRKTWRIHGVRADMRNHFPRQKYCRRALIETVFSVAKRKVSCRTPGRCLLTQRRQALLLGLTYNLYRLQHVLSSFRMSTEPDTFKKLHADVHV